MAKHKPKPWDEVFSRVQVHLRADHVYPEKQTKADINRVGKELGIVFPDRTGNLPPSLVSAV